MIMKKKINWNVVINATLTFITTILSAVTLHACAVGVQLA